MTEWSKKNQKITRTKENDLGATMRLGSYPCYIKHKSLASKIYKKKLIHERPVSYTHLTLPTMLMV